MITNGIYTGDFPAEHDYLVQCGVQADQLYYDRFRDDVVSWIVDPEVTFHPNHGLYYRKSSYDHQFYSEVPHMQKLGIQHGDRVLDVGGNAGLFAVWAARQGASVVVTCEPSNENMLITKANLAHAGVSLQVVTVEAAAVPNAAVGSLTMPASFPTVPLYFNKGKGRGMHSLLPRRGRQAYDVGAARWDELMAIFSPSVVKVDIEGGEYTLFEELKQLPGCVQRIYLELHLTNRQWRAEYAPYLASLLQAQFYILEQPVIDGKLWTTRFIGYR